MLYDIMMLGLATKVGAGGSGAVNAILLLAIWSSAAHPGAPERYPRDASTCCRDPIIELPVGLAEPVIDNPVPGAPGPRCPGPAPKRSQMQLMEAPLPPDFGIGHRRNAYACVRILGWARPLEVQLFGVSGDEAASLERLIRDDWEFVPFAIGKGKSDWHRIRLTQDLGASELP